MAVKHFKVLVNKESEHNKYWGYKVEDPPIKLTIFWGRIGTTGNSDVSTYSNIDGAHGIGETKINEKIRKGYREVTQNEFELMNFEAKTVGSNHKISSKFVRLDGNIIHLLKDPTEMNNPGAKIGIYIELSDSNLGTDYHIIGENDGNFVITTAGIVQGNPIRILSKVEITQHRDFKANSKNTLYKVNHNISDIFNILLRKAT